MSLLNNLEMGKRVLYSQGHFSGEYNQDLYIKRSVDDGSKRPKYYIGAFSNLNGSLIQQSTFI